MTENAQLLDKKEDGVGAESRPFGFNKITGIIVSISALLGALIGLLALVAKLSDSARDAIAHIKPIFPGASSSTVTSGIPLDSPGIDGRNVNGKLGAEVSKNEVAKMHVNPAPPGARPSPDCFEAMSIDDRSFPTKITKYWSCPSEVGK